MENRMIPNKKEKSKRIFKVLIRIMNKSLSMDIPGDWKVSKIRKFLESQFHEQTKNSTINIVYSGKQITNDEDISDIIIV